MSNEWLTHLIVAPVLLPLIASAIMLLTNERSRATKNAIGFATLVGLLSVNVMLLAKLVAAENAGELATRAYLLGDWPAPFGIVLVADWLSVLMLILTTVVALAGFLYATAGWERAGPRFHALFLLQITGLNGAFLTGDLFNLFVFFEVLLAASYGLLLHGSGKARVKAGLHYVTINVFASLLFLIGAALIYGISGTLNMADLARQLSTTRQSDLALLQSGMAVLGVAFLIKAGMWPVGIWLPRTYAAAPPPSAALFVILSKVGIYAVLRVYLLLFGAEAGWTANFGEEWLLFGGMVTIAFGTVGVLATRTLKGVAGYSVLVSSGSLLAVIGAGRGAVLEGALFYLVSSTLAIAAFYLLVELLERTELDAEIEGADEPVFDDEYTGAVPVETETEVGVVIPATIAVLGGGFILCALMLSGLPPLPGFVAKVAMIDGLLDLGDAVPVTTWWLVALLVLSGLATLVATTRAGIDLLWTPEQTQPPLRIREAVPVGLLLMACLAIMVFAGPMMQYMERTGQSLADRENYIAAVLGTSTVKPRKPAP